MFVSNTGGSPAAPGPTGPTYQVPRSLRFTSAGTKWLSRTVSGASSRVFTVSAWTKVVAPSGVLVLGGTDAALDSMYLVAATSGSLMSATFVVGGTQSTYVTTAVFRDPTAWYHMVFAVDTTQATAANRVRFYVNGVLQPTSFSAGTFVAQNASLYVNGGMGINNRPTGSTPTGGFYGDGYLADYYYIDGQALDPSYFGQTDSTWGTWTAKAYVPNVIAGFGQFPDSAPSDPSFANVSLLLHGNGTNGSTTITDSSPSPRTVTAFGNAQIGTTQSKFGGASIYFDGTGDYLTAGSFSFTGDFTIEFWLYGYIASQCLFSSDANPVTMLYNDTLTLNGTSVVAAIGLTAALTSWKHIAVVRSGSTVSVYEDGVFRKSGTFGATVNLAGMAIGRFTPNDNLYFSGYMDEFRITTGVARYSSNFSVAAPHNGYGTNGFYLPFSNTTSTTTLGYDYQTDRSATGDIYFEQVRYLLHFDSGYTDQKGSIWTASGSTAISPINKWGGGAVLTPVAPVSNVSAPNTAMPTGDLTIEFWVYPSLDANYGVMFNTVGATNTNGFLFQVNSDGAIESKIYNGGGQAGFVPVAAAGALVANVWQHIAWTRTGATTRLFVNGVQQATGSYGAAVSHNSPVQLGGSAYGANAATIRFDDLRITSIARYTSAFTPPTAAFLDYGFLPNDWTPNNISLTAGATYDSMYDVPLGAGSSVGNGLGNYATLNPLVNTAGLYNVTNGNLSGNVGGFDKVMLATHRVPSSGKWYWECSIATAGLANVCGVIDESVNSSSGSGFSGGNYRFYFTNGTKSNSGVQTGYGATYTTGDVISCAVDSDAGTITFYKNNVSQGIAFSDLTSSGKVFFPASYLNSATATVNFGQQPFTYTPPVGYLALHTGNLPTPAIQKPNQYFDAVTYTGGGLNFTTPTSVFPDAAPADPYFSNVVALLHCDGSNGSTSLLDSSSAARAYTANGSAQISTAQSKFGGASAIFGTTNANNFSAAASADFAINGGDFTVEFWIYQTAYNSGCDIIGATGGAFTENSTNGIHWIVFGTTNGVAMQHWNGSGLTNLNVTASLNTWHHIAFTRSGNTMRAFVNGVVGTTSASFSVSPSGTPSFGVGRTPGHSIFSGYTYIGHLDDIRITKGVARYPSPRGVTNPGAFQPDLVWIKSRSAATDNKLSDSVRGVTKAVVSNSATAETTDTGGVTAFNSNGFTLGADTNYNTASATYVAWQWKANGAAATNTSGTITSQVSANPSAGFSVVTYTGTNNDGATVGHGLGVVPSMIIVRGRNFAANGRVFHASLSANNNLYMNATNAQDVITVTGGGGIGTSPTSSVYTCVTGASSNANNVNQNTWTYVAYCFAPVAGYSAFGSYAGNSSADGPFIYCGFKPRWILLKKYNTGISSWLVLDTARYPNNVQSYYLLPDNPAAEAAGLGAILDINSNGFKLRISANYNASGEAYIYAAFAENPFKYALAR